MEKYSFISRMLKLLPNSTIRVFLIAMAVLVVLLTLVVLNTDVKTLYIQDLNATYNTAELSTHIDYLLETEVELKQKIEDLDVAIEQLIRVNAECVAELSVLKQYCPNIIPDSAENDALERLLSQLTIK